MAEEKKGERKPDEARKPAQGDSGGKNEKPHKGTADKPRRDEKTRQPTRSRGSDPRRDAKSRKGGGGGKPGRDDRGRGKPRGGRQQLAARAEEEARRVVHLAAQAGVRYSLENPRAYLDANVIGTFNVMEAARRL